MSPPPVPDSLPRQFLAVVRVILGIGLGLFVIFHAFFLVAYNLVDMSSTALDNLKKQRRVWERSQDPRQILEPEEDPTIWPRVTRVPLAGRYIEEWVDKDRESRLSKAKAWIEPRLDHYARLTGQEQGWSLFAPSVVDWTCLLSLEMRWDDDLLDNVPPGVPRSMLLLSDNHPRDINCFFRFGHFRLRRFEAKMETAFRKFGDDEETYRGRWERRAKEKVRGDENSSGNEDEIMIYFRWKLRKFQQDYPDLPEPKQIILRSHTWTIPPPPGPSPWTWIDESDEPVCRWRPSRHLPRGENLELYLHSENRFESKNPTRWPANP